MRRDQITCGHDIDNQANSSPEKVEAVLDAPRPQRVTEVRSFVGFVNYYNRFMANRSTVHGTAFEPVVREEPTNKILKFLFKISLLQTKLCSDLTKFHFKFCHLKRICQVKFCTSAKFPQKFVLLEISDFHRIL